MKKRFSIFIIVSILFFIICVSSEYSSASNGNENWYEIYPGENLNWFWCIQQTTDGGYITVGATHASEIGAFASIWLIKTYKNGEKVWEITFGDKDIFTDYGYFVEQTIDGGYIITGQKGIFTTNTDVWLIKTDANGNKIWSKTFGGHDIDVGFCVHQTTNGDYIIGGIYSSSYGGYDVWLIKTDANGNKIWSKTFGGSKDDICWNVQQTDDGGYIIVGETQSFGNGGKDVWLIKTDANGNKIWSKTFGGSKDDVGHSIQKAPDKGYAIAGATSSFGNGEEDAWLIKVDEKGNEIWNKTFGGNKKEWFREVVVTTDEEYIMVGGTYSYTHDSYSDGWVVRYKPFIEITSIEKDNLYIGMNYNITWQYENSGTFVRIELYKNTSHVKTIVNTTLNDGFYQWNISHDILPDIDYRFKISSISTEIFDYSPNFTILKPISLLSQDLETEKNKKINIKWSSFINDSVSIYLYKNGYLIRRIAENITNSGNYSWFIPGNIENGKYAIKIVSVENENIYDISYITIKEPWIHVMERNLWLVILLLLIISGSVGGTFAFLKARERKRMLEIEKEEIVDLIRKITKR